MLERPHHLVFSALVFAFACSSDPALPSGSGTPSPTDADEEREEPVAEAKVDAAPAKAIDGGKTILLDAGLALIADAGAAAPSVVRDAQLTLDASSDASLDAAGSPPRDIEFEACLAELEQGCSDDDREVGCASVKTPLIPLRAGGNWGGKLVQGGPYGALVEWNRGAAFANTMSLLESSCDRLATTFGEPDSVTADALDLGGSRLDLYTVFRPACMKPGETYPVITWGNGTCGQTHGYHTLLATLASYGYVVVAANSRFTDSNSKVMLRALDFAQAANSDESSSLYQRLDLSRIGAMGHSQGANATSRASSDARIKSLILWNGGGTNDKPFLLVSGERDIGNPALASVAAKVKSSAQPGAWLYYHQILQTGGNATGHLTLMEQPERVTDVALAWWDYQLKGKPVARAQFLGTDCGLCNHKDEYEYGQNNLE
jgi:pimeloyl-ACP methyl ester carboxylesterase